MSEPAEASMTNVVPMPPRRPSQLDEFAEQFAAAYPQVVRTLWFVIHDRIAVRTTYNVSGNLGPVVEISVSDGRELAEHPDDGGWLIWPASEGW